MRGSQVLTLHILLVEGSDCKGTPATALERRHFAAFRAAKHAPRMFSACMCARVNLPGAKMSNFSGYRTD